MDNDLGQKPEPSDQRTNSPAHVQQQEPSSQKANNQSFPIEIQKVHSASQPIAANQRRSPGSSKLMLDANGEPVPLDKIIKTANTMSSIMMAHRIALEEDFRLEPGMDMSGPLMSLSPIIGSSPSAVISGVTQASEPNLQSRVKDIVHEAFWDLFKEELKSQTSDIKEERKFDISKQLLRDIKQKIIDLLLPQHTRLKLDIEDRLDPQILDQLSKVESLNLLDYSRYILSVMTKLCAPVRDERLKELSDETDIVQLYRGIMELLEMMRLDFANFTLNRFKPHIKAHSQEYEREKFNEILKQQESIGIDGLEYTKIWLSRAACRVDEMHGIADFINEAVNNSDLDHEELNQPVQGSVACNSSLDSSSHCSIMDKILRSDIVNKILNSAYSELLEWSTDKQKLFPEALLFDEATFKQLGEQYKVLVLTSSILLTTFAFVTRFKLHDDNEFRTLLKSNVITLLTASYDNEPTTTKTVKVSVSGTPLDNIKLETIATRLSEDIRQRLESNQNILETFDGQKELFMRQILDIQSPSNRIRELARRRILEFVETLLMLDVEHQRKRFASSVPPPVNIPLGLNCLADEITLTMAQLVKIIRYNRKVFFKHYQDIIVAIVSKNL